MTRVLYRGHYYVNADAWDKVRILRAAHEAASHNGPQLIHLHAKDDFCDESNHIRVTVEGEFPYHGKGT